MKEIDAAKEKIIRITQLLIYKGLIKTSGHVSMRVAPDRFLITGHIHGHGRSLHSLTPEDIVLCDLRGKSIQGTVEPPGEVFIHSCIYTARPDVNSVLHNHPLYSTILAIAGKRVVPVFTSGVIFAPGVPVYDDPNHIDTEQRGVALALALGNAQAVLMRGHGNVTVGPTLEQAAAVAIRLEENALMQLMAYQAGAPRAIGPEDVDPALAKRVISLESAHALMAFCQEEMSKGR